MKGLFFVCSSVTAVVLVLPSGLAGQATREVMAPPASATPFQQRGETIERSRSAEIDILNTVLKFYGPPGNQSRWLDAERLPPSQGATARPLGPEMIADLIRSLGPGRFCASDNRDSCRSTVGGGLRVSLVYRSDEAHARVAVRFESHWLAAPSVANTQVFFLERRGSAWRIAKRATGVRQP